MKKELAKILQMVLMMFVAWLVMNSEGVAQVKGGAKRPANVQKPAAKPANVKKPAAKPANVQKPSNVQKPDARPSNAKTTSTGTKSSGNRAGGENGKFSNNNVKVDNSRGDVNINVDNSKDIKVQNNRNTVVRHNTYRPYTRPPYVYGGYRYRCYHPYYYHPYRPFVWGPVWHPWGFFIATLTATAIIVSFADADLPPVVDLQEILARMDQDNMTNNLYRIAGPNALIEEQLPMAMVPNAVSFPALADGEYYYDQGIFYLKEKEGYTVVAAPVGAVIKTLPAGYETVVVDETTGVKNYYWGGTFYEKISSGYKVVPPTSGTIVEHISDGGEEVKLGDITYVKLGETYYQPIQLNGKNVYEVVDVEEDK